MAAGAGGEPPAEARELEGLREVPQGQPVRAELVLQCRTEHSCLYACGPAHAVDLQDPVETGEIEAHRGSVEARLDPADDRGAAPKGHDRHARRRRPVEDGDDVLLMSRSEHEVGSMPHVALEVAHDVAIGLAVRVRRAIRGVVGRDPRQGVRSADPGLREAEVGDLGRLVDGEVVVGQEGRHPGHELVGLGAGHGVLDGAPTPPGSACHVVDPRGRRRAGSPIGDQSVRMSTRPSSPAKSSGLRVYSRASWAWAVAAMSRSMTRRRGRRPASTTAAASRP